MLITVRLFFVALLIPGVAAAEPFKAPDILVDSKLNYDWSMILVNKYRKLLKNFEIEDPFNGKIPGAVMLDESKVGEFLPEDSKAFISDFGNSVGLSVLNGDSQVWLHDFSYDVRGFKADLKNTEIINKNLSLVADFSASRLDLKASKVSIKLMVPGIKSSPALTVEVIEPSLSIDQENLISFFARVNIEDQKDHYKFRIQRANFDQMADSILENKKGVNLSFKRVIVPKIDLKVGNKVLHFSPEKVESFIFANSEAIKGILMSQVAETLRTNTEASAIELFESMKLEKEYWLDTDVIKSQLKIENFSTTNLGHNIAVNLPGNFCTNDKFLVFKSDCTSDQNKITKSAPSRLVQANHDRSVEVMRNLMEKGDANFVASISEDYLNKLLVTTIDAGLWQDSLKEAEIGLGPNKVVLKLDKRGDSGTLIMDVVYKPSGLERIAIGAKTVRFPLVLDISVRVEVEDQEAVFIVHLNDVDDSQQTLLNGRPVENMVSTIKDIPRFKKSIVKAIQEKLKTLRNKDIVELRYPELEGLGLDKVNFLSDGNGRMNAIMRLEDILPSPGF